MGFQRLPRKRGEKVIFFFENLSLLGQTAGPVPDASQQERVVELSAGIRGEEVEGLFGGEEEESLCKGDKQQEEGRMALETRVQRHRDEGRFHPALFVNSTMRNSVTNPRDGA